MAPWVHLHLRARGGVAACCEAKGDVGAVDKAGFEHAWNGPEMRALRTRLMVDQRDERCWKCYQVEASGTASFRQYLNRAFAHHARRLARTGADGSLDGAPPVSWDLRFSNLCNFRCRMCWHGSSSRWFEDAQATGQAAATSALIRSVEDPRRFLDQVADHLPHLESIRFAGGEPLLAEEHYLILEALIRHGRTGVQISYSTNLSQLSLAGRSVLDLWPHFANVSVVASADGTKARGELIRNGLDWRQFLINARLVRERCPRLWLGFAAAVSVFNVLHLPELHRTLVGTGIIPPHDLVVHVLQEPAWYSVSILTDGLKRAACDALEAHRRWIEGWYQEHSGADPAGRDRTLSQLNAVNAFLAVPADPTRQRRFRELTAQLDVLRGENLQAVFPELAPMFAPSI